MIYSVGPATRVLMMMIHCILMHEKAFYRAWLPFYQTCWEVTRVLQDCGLQLNDEEGHRCYPLEGHLLCHRCHLHRLKTPVPTHPPPSYPLHVTELWTHRLALKKRTVWRQARTINRGIGLRISTCLGFKWPTREAFFITLIPHHLLPLTFFRSGSLYRGVFAPVVTQNALWQGNVSSERQITALNTHRLRLRLLVPSSNIPSPRSLPSTCTISVCVCVCVGASCLGL